MLMPLSQLYYPRVVMNRYGALFLLLLATLLTVACGNSTRQLQSVTIRATKNGAQIHYWLWHTRQWPVCSQTAMAVREPMWRA